jgi:hypothetical protein
MLVGMKCYGKRGVQRDVHERNFDATDIGRLFENARKELKLRAKPILDKLAVGHLRVHIEIPRTNGAENIYRYPATSTAFGNDIIIHVELQGMRFFLDDRLFNFLVHAFEFKS